MQRNRVPLARARPAIRSLQTLLRLKTDDTDSYAREIAFAERYTAKWDEPDKRLFRPGAPRFF